MKLEEIIEKLMNIGDCCPCECDLPCPFYEKDNPYVYCNNMDCVEGMTILIKKLCKEE